MITRRLSRLIRKAAAALGLVAASVVAFDVAAYFGFPHLVQRIEPEYANHVGPELWRQNRVQTPYEYSETRGFDIEPGDRSIAWHPPEIPPYEIWGNSVGCFDDEPPAGRPPDIYLAGDSFTWGWSPYEDKFGTIIERRTGLLVYACGVAHTGQRHQFDKFLEVSRSFPGWPALVIVNVFISDIANDRAFPHTVVIDGTWYEDTYLGEQPDRSTVVRMTRAQQLAASGDVRYYIKTYSASANILYELVRTIRGQGVDEDDSILNVYDIDEFPIRSGLAEEHRRIMRKWVSHAAENDYEIRFALIPYRDGIGADAYAEYREFIEEIGSAAWDFESHVLSNGLDPKDLYWQVDIHFNPRGNAAYARFLLEMLDREARAGRLPPRFAVRRALSEGQRSSGPGRRSRP